jgi:hypothetical protein
MKMTKIEKEHFNEFIKIAKEHNLELPPLSYFGINSIGELLEKYKKDNNLNNIPLRLFNNLYYSIVKIRVKKSALYMGACIYKNLLIKLLINNGLLNDEIKKENRIIMIIEEAKRLNNRIDCDVVQEAMTILEKRKKNEDVLNMFDYLITSLEYRSQNDLFNLNYIKRLISEYKEIN